jgi:hypothetical protein
MVWPSIEDYRTAFQNPSQAFPDARLQCCVPERNKMGLPRGRAGGYAIVYRMSNSSWSTAVRVFLHQPNVDRHKRYQMVHDYLQQTRPRCLVDFGYDPEGIVIEGRGFPIQTLEWVEGLQLGEWVKGALSRGDTRSIKQIADAWIELVGELRSHGIAHGDLQHGNILVVGDRLVLVDYDCMYVPTMTTDADREAWEFGMPGYQHPGRVGQPLGPEFDSFSAWAILIGLRAVADDPDLWWRYVGAPEVENLLFTRDDIEFPQRSPLWPELIQNAKDRKVREWAAMLRASLDGPFEQIPPFELDIFDPIRTVIAGGDWRQIHELATSKKYANKTFPADVAATVQEATQRLECLNQLEAKLGAGRLKEIAAAYRPALLDDWADPLVLGKARAAAGAVEILAELARAEQDDPGGRFLVELWQRRGSALQGLVEGNEFRDKAAAWQTRIAAAERLDAVVKQGNETAIAQAWLEVVQSGGHPDAEIHRGRAEGGLRRLDALRRLSGLSHREDESSDQALLTVWENVAASLDTCPEADVYRPRVTNAQQRMAQLEAVYRIIEEANRGRRPERDVVAAFEALPTGYGAAQVNRVELARARIATAEALEQALKGCPPSDLALADAAERARKGGIWPTDAAIAARCTLAIRRRDALSALDAIPKKLPVDDRDSRWRDLWDEELLRGCVDARDHRLRYQLALRRIAAAAELEAALAASDAATVKRLSRDPEMAEHPCVVRRRAEIEDLIATSERIERLVAAIQRGDAQAFFNEAEIGLIKAHSGAFLPHRARIDGWIDNRLRENAVLGPADPPFLRNSTTGTLIARWSWVEQRWVRHCLVAADPARFFERPEEAKGRTLNLDPDAHRRAQGGAAVLSPPDCRRLYVTIWPVVDLGWGRRTGPPLRIGPNVDGPPPVKSTTGDAVPDPRKTSVRTRFRKWLVHLINNI